MAKYILNFGEDPLHHIHGGFVPEHTRPGLEAYLFKGWEPGSFMMAALVGGLYEAAFRADSENRKELAHIAIWIMHNAPPLSYGSVQKVEDWINDVGGRRTSWATAIEKKFMWDKLSESE